MLPVVLPTATPVTIEGAYRAPSEVRLPEMTTS